MEFYKFNPKNTGSFCSFNYSAGLGQDKAFFLEIGKQLPNSWSNGTGSVDQNKKTRIKLSIKEIGGLLRILENNESVPMVNGKAEPTNNQKVSYFHKNAKGTKQINFTKTEWNNKILFGFSVNVKEGGSDSFRISFDEDEARLLKQYFEFGLERVFLGIQAERKKKFQESQKSKE